jgi:hypothetical protein
MIVEEYGEKCEPKEIAREQAELGEDERTCP